MNRFEQEGIFYDLGRPVYYGVVNESVRIAPIIL